MRPYCNKCTDDVTACKQQKVRIETTSSGVTVVLYWRCDIFCAPIMVQTHAGKWNRFAIYIKNVSQFCDVICSCHLYCSNIWLLDNQIACFTRKLLHKLLYTLIFTPIQIFGE